jgi:hypothetical protein
VIVEKTKYDWERGGRGNNGTVVGSQFGTGTNIDSSTQHKKGGRDSSLSLLPLSPPSLSIFLDALCLPGIDADGKRKKKKLSLSVAEREADTHTGLARVPKEEKKKEGTKLRRGRRKVEE